MGIRKHFEKKPPDEDLKLQDLALEQGESRPELKFDPGTAISETDWQNTKNELESFRHENRWWVFATRAMCLKILFPDKTAELDLDPAWQGMKDALESYRQADNWWNFANQAMQLKILFPDKTAELDLNDLAWQGMKNKLEYYRQGSWHAFADQAMNLKILFPDRTAELDLNDSAWQGMKEELESDRRNNNWGDFTSQATELKILAANEVKVTDQGLEITMRPLESFKSEKKPRPERKNF